jgi:hypothetical protein
MKKHISRGRAALLGLLGLGALAFSAGPARAAVVHSVAPRATAGCDPVATITPFARWNDANEYKLVDGSSFGTSTSGWTLAGGAHLVSGGEPWGVTGQVSRSALSLPQGAWAQSPFTCVDLADPTWRFFAANATSRSTLQVSVVYTTPLLGQVVTPVGTQTQAGGWTPSQTMLTADQLQALLKGGAADVALRFTATSGTSNIDDVFIDPRMSWR